jgi:hypothetical protein
MLGLGIALLHSENIGDGQGTDSQQILAVGMLSKGRSDNLYLFLKIMAFSP